MKPSHLVTKMTWKEFHSTGLLLIVNQVLQAFGWSIVLECSKDGEIMEVYPARVKLRGFDEATTDEGYTKLTRWMHANADSLLEEVEEDSN